MHPKLYIGPVSINTIDAAIEFSNENKVCLGLIPSRRQVDFCGGYLNLNTKKFSNYIRNRSDLVVIERDHGGPLQGYEVDNGIESFIEDAKFFDIIHIDPFKKYKCIIECAEHTILHIQYLSKINNKLKFEIGTEQGIREYSNEELNYFIEYIHKNLNKKTFEKIIYLVVQGGTKVFDGKNTARERSDGISGFIDICRKYKKSSKEHNGDYLELFEIKSKFDLGLDAINIAPEFGSLESEVWIEKFSESDFNTFFDLVLNSKRWIKWFDKDFEPHSNKEKLIKMCGHYVFENQIFKDIKKGYPEMDILIKKKIKEKISKIMEL